MNMPEILDGIDTNRAVDYLLELIRIPSQSGNEGRLGEFIYNKLESFGLEVEKQIVESDRFNIKTVIKGEQPGPRIMVSGHIDTVSPVPIHMLP